MLSARFNSSAILAIALVFLGIGVGLGFVLAPADLSGSVEASGQALGPGSETTSLSLGSGSKSTAMSGVSQDSNRASAGIGEATKTEVSAARMEDALAEIDLPSARMNTTGFGGDGEITGSVFDENGSPLGNITVIATRSDLRLAAGGTTDHIGAGAPPDDSLRMALEKAAESWAEGRDKRARVTTNSNGKFRLSGLTDGRYRVSAYKEGWVLSANGARECFPGDELTFRAMRVSPLTLNVTLPDGTKAESAIVEISYGRNSEEAIWTPEEPTLRLSSPRLQLRVFAGMLETREYQRDTKSLYRSEQMTIDAEALAGATLEVVLEARPGIQGKLTKSWTGLDTSQVMIATLESEADFKPEGPHKGRQTTAVQSGEFLFLDLEEGLYVVGIQDGRSSKTELVNHQFVQVTDGLVQVDLDVPTPDSSEHLLLYCLDPKGQPHSGVSLRSKASWEGGSDNNGLRPKTAPDGAYWVRKDSLGMPDYNAWSVRGKIVLTATSQLYGTQTLELTGAVGEATINFTDPVSLTVNVAGYADLEYKDEVSVNVMAQDSQGNYSSEVASSNNNRRGNNSPSFTKAGDIKFTSIAPGTYEVQLRKGGRWGGGDIMDQITITLGSSDSSVQLTPPRLHDFVVYAPGLADRTYLILTPVSSNADNSNDNFFGGMGYYGGSSGTNARLDSTKRAVFKNLKPGMYTLKNGWSGEGVEVTVPGGEFVFEPKMPNVIKIAISDKEGQMHKAGLRGGDVILSVNGVSVEEKGLYQGAFSAMQKGGAQVLMRRDGGTLTVEISAIAGKSQDQGMMGGMFLPEIE
ncbi:MAG: protocatechuate 3,4-dioxygenase beta subunit [Planctomycetota bacterium]|jgi:protocatechuate 3,4-dioxygenase beta subunit